MLYTRTTTRIQTPLKKAAYLLAAQTDITFQAIINEALSDYLKNTDKQTAKKLTFKTADLGTGFDNLTRDDYYQEPKS